MRALWAVALGVWGLGDGVAISAHAATACPASRSPIVLDFQTLQAEPKLNSNLNVSGIRGLLRDRDKYPANAHGQALGLTLTNPVFALDARTRIEPQRGGGYCVYLERVRAEFGFRRLEVYVASEFPPGSCEYRAILDHENQHVGINRDALAAYAGRLRLELERILGEQKPVVARDVRGSPRDILADISRRANASVEAFHADIDGRNAAIDTQSNYDAIADICNNWKRGTVGPRKQPN